MTRFSDNIESGIQAATSAYDSRATVLLTRSHKFTGGGNQTWTGYFPSNVQDLDATLFICSNGSAATSDKFTITASAGSTALGTISSVGSAGGVLRSTFAGLGTLSMVASACALVGPTQPNEVQVPFQVILSSVDTATEYRLMLSFRRAVSTAI